MIDLFTQFKNIIESTGLNLLDVACLVYIFKQLLKMVVYTYKKIKGDV